MNLTKILERAGKLHIAVVGDLIEDIYIDGTVERISPEAPVVILNVSGMRSNPGGAGNVVENLRSLGVLVTFAHQRHIPTKTRVMSGSHHLLRMDDEREVKSMKSDDAVLDNVIRGIEEKYFDAVIMSDYGKGTLNWEVAERIISLCLEHDIPTIVDTKYNHDLFGSVTLLKCNQKEWATFNAGRYDWPKQWMATSDVKNVVITKGDRGMEYFGNDGWLEYMGHLTAHDVQMSDSCGAGDTVTAVLGIMMALDEPISDACELANIAASEVCRHPGVEPISISSLKRRYSEVIIEQIPTPDESKIHTDHAPVQSLRLQSDASEDSGSYQTHIQGENGRGDEGDEAREKPSDTGGATEPE